jgi:glycosyltransferase involved in cell wall biosynthesis
MQSKFSFNSFSIVIPIFNEQEILEESVNNIFAICKRTQKKFEIILSENGSNDNTLEIAKKISNEHSEIKVISSNTPNYGMALRSGFIEASNSLVVSFDIDYYSESFLNMALMLEEDFSAITASKRLVQSNDGRRFVRKIATNTFVFLLKLLFRTTLSDTHGMKAIKKICIDEFVNDVVSTQDIFDTELLIRIEKSGKKIKEVPAIVNEIRPSVSVIYKRIPRTLKSLIKLKIVFYKESLKTNSL